MATIKQDELYNADDELIIPIIQDGISFNVMGGDSFHTLKTKASVQKSMTIGGGKIYKPAVNAVDIDWNNAQLGDTIINTTGQLLSYISEVTNKVPTSANSISIDTDNNTVTLSDGTGIELNIDVEGKLMLKKVNSINVTTTGLPIPPQPTTSRTSS